MDENQQQKMKESPSLDVEYIQKKLDEGFQYTEETRGRDLVLIIGNTGVGKSTTCNYLMGYEMVEVEYEGSPVIDTVDETPIKIGHEVTSETLYAKSLVADCNEKGKSPVCLLDCPGFLGNRTIEEKVIESISTELAVRSARQIKGILILLSLNTLKETRVKELRELVKTLIFLFKDPVEMVQYSIFIITKKDSYMPEDRARGITSGALTKLKKHCENESSKLRNNPCLKSSEGLASIDYDRISSYFSAVLGKRDEIIFIDPLDNGESRRLIFNRIHGIKLRKGVANELIKPITIDDFNFSERNEDRDRFNKALYGRANDGIKFMNDIQNHSVKFGSLRSEIDSAYRELSKLEDLQRCQEEEIENKTSKDFESLRILEETIFENKKKIKSRKRGIEETETKREKVQEQLKNLDTDKPTLFIEKSIHKYCGVFRWEELDFEADTGDRTVPIVKVIRSKENGSWVSEVDERDDGIYKTRYESCYTAKPAAASVKTYIKFKDEAGNRLKIKQLQEDLDQLKKEKEKLEDDMDELKYKSKNLKRTITEATENKERYRKSLKQKLKECKNDIKNIKAKIVEMKKDRANTRLSGLALIEEFKKNDRKFNIIISIATLLNFPSDFITDFVSQYNEFLSSIDIYRSSFEDNPINSLSESSSSAVEETEVKEDDSKEISSVSEQLPSEEQSKEEATV